VHAFAWQFSPWVSAGMAAAAAGYLAAVIRVSHRHPARPWPATRTAAYLLGLAVITAATQGGVAVYDDVLFSAHMVQHVVLIMVAPPLLVFGRPVTLTLHASGNPLHTWVKRLVRSRAVTALTWPPGTLVLYAAVVAGTHTPPVMDLVLSSQAAHAAEHLLYLLSGYAFFLLVIGSEPIRWRVPMPGRLLLLLAAMQVDTVVGVVLMVQGREIFPAYARAAPAWGPGLVADLHQGGVVMFAGSDVVMTVLALVVSVRFIRGSGSAASPGRWVEGLRRAALMRRLTAAGQGVPGTAAAGRTIDDDAHLAAYNAYLSALGGRHPGGSWSPPAASSASGAPPPD
jgi:putative copper resistance protein D